MPLFGAFVRARVCWCSECGQAARIEQVGADLYDEAVGCERDAAGRRGQALAVAPRWRAAGGAAGPRGAGGRGSLCFVCGSGGAWALSLFPGGAAVVGRGRGQVSEPRALAPGCRRVDNRGRGPSFPSPSP